MARNASRPSESAGPIIAPSPAVGRPLPPDELCGIYGATSADRMMPSRALEQWARATFIGFNPDEDGYAPDAVPLVNPDHEHLRGASIGFVWTNAINRKGGKLVLGQAQLMPPGGGDAWGRARAAQQILEWFGEMPDFVITLLALEAAEMDDATFCALVEHELYHCAQKLDDYGSPCFDRATGDPLWAIRSHDIEQFVGVALRYGAVPSGLGPLADALASGPTVSEARMKLVCGSC